MSDQFKRARNNIRLDVHRRKRLAFEAVRRSGLLTDRAETNARIWNAVETALQTALLDAKEIEMLNDTFFSRRLVNEVTDETQVFEEGQIVESDE